MSPDLLDSSAAIGIPLALTAAVFLAIGTQFQHRGVSVVNAASTTDAKTGLSFAQLAALIARPSWVIGTVLLGLSVVLQLVSLTFAALTVVQPLGAIALIITSIVNSRVTRTPLDRFSIRSIIVCVGGISIFVTIAAFVSETHPITETQLATVLIILAVVLVVISGLFLLIRGRSPRPIFYIVAAGILFGFVVTLAKVVIDRVRTIISIDFFDFGPADFLTVLCIIGFIAAALLGIYFVQTAHSSNPPDLVVAGLTVIDPLVAVSIGILVLGEASRAPLWAMILFVLAGAAAIGGVLSLARHHPHTRANAVPADEVDDLGAATEIR